MSTSEFSPTLLHSLMVFILSETPRELGAIELAKIVYLIDVEKVRVTGETMTSQSYTRQSKGPLARDFDSCNTDMDGFEISVTVGPSRGASRFSKKGHSVGDKPRFRPSLDPIDAIIARRVLSRIKNLSPRQIERLAYDTEPMQAILHKEARMRERLLGAPIDFSLVQPHPLVRKWQENMARPAIPDSGFEAFLGQEADEIDQILTSLA